MGMGVGWELGNGSWVGAWELGGSMGMAVGWEHGTGETAWEWGGRKGIGWEHGGYSLVPRPLSTFYLVAVEKNREKAW